MLAVDSQGFLLYFCCPDEIFFRFRTCSCLVGKQRFDSGAFYMTSSILLYFHSDCNNASSILLFFRPCLKLLLMFMFIEI